MINNLEFTVKFFRAFLTALFLAALLLAAFTLVTSKADVLGGLRSFTVLSGSMQPTVPVGSVVFVQPQQTYSFNDIVAFKNKAGLTVTHRIFQSTIKNGDIFYRTKGDANGQADSEVISSKDIIGKEIFFVPEIGRLSDLLKNPYGFIGLVVTPTVIFIGLEILNIKREMEKEIEKKLLAQMGMNYS